MKISISDLEKQYPGGKYALRDVNLEISTGMFGLLGPNGAGKTTLMRILVTMLLPSKGQVTVGPWDIRKNRKEIREQVGYLPQEFSKFAKIAVWEFLDHVAALSGVKSKSERMKRVDKLLDDVGLFDVRDRMANKLSGGMKRRLGIAQTLIGEPRIIIVDEPTVGLDPEERLRFRNLMTDLSRQERIIILSTHIVGDISSTCTSMALLSSGKVVFQGAPEQLVAFSEGKVWQVAAAGIEIEKLREQFPVISAIPSVAGYDLRIVAEDRPTANAVTLDPNLEDAYVYFMQTLGHDMSLEATDNAW